MKIGIDIGGSHTGMAIVEGNKIVKKYEVEYKSEGDMTEYIQNILVSGMEELVSDRLGELNRKNRYYSSWSCKWSLFWKAS